MRSWASRLWDALWDTRAWRDQDRVATVLTYVVFVAAAVLIAWIWPMGTVWEVSLWTMLFVFLGVSIWYGKRRARRRQPARQSVEGS